MNYVFVAIGGALGSLIRYLVSVATFQALHYPAMPWGTLTVNLSGSFLIGILAGINETDPFHPGLRSFVFVGLLGGYTTFSSFSLETIQLFRTGLTGYAFGNILISNLGGMLLAGGGFYLSKLILQLFK